MPLRIIILRRILIHCHLWLHGVDVSVPRVVDHLLHLLLLDNWNSRWSKLSAGLEPGLLLNLGHTGVRSLLITCVKVVLLHILLLLVIVAVVVAVLGRVQQCSHVVL